MDSDLQQQQQPPQMNPPSGLTRYRSAPSSYFSDIIDREFYEHIFSKPSSPETERVFSRFMNSFSSGGGGGGGVDGGGAAPEEDDHHPVSAPVKREIDHHDHHNEQVVLQQQSSEIINDYNKSVPPPQSFYQKPPLPNQNLQSGGGGGGNNSNLIRHSSSPAGLFSQINIENVAGYAGVRGMGTLGAVNNSLEGAKFSSARRLKNPQSYSSVAMSTIAEIGDKGNRENNSDSEAFSERIGNDFITGFPVGAWDDSAMMSDNVSGLKRFRDDDTKPFSGLSAAETQNEAGGQSSSSLVHQMSMPNTSSEMAAIEKFLHFSDSVPCKIRAKRGFATHPRSIAERVRRTKISERMRKLQDLVPNMDKQTNTADMLDLAVDYIKDLQNQVQTLSDCQAKCTCSHKQQQ